MPVTGHDILTNADLFRAAYPNWPSAETDPLAGPFMSAVQLTDYSDDPEFAILLPESDGTGGELARIERQF
jgi:hypothetical protein